MLDVSQLVGFGTRPITPIHTMCRFQGGASSTGYLRRTAAFTGDADAKTGTVSYWVRFYDDNVGYTIFGPLGQGLSRQAFGRTPTNKLFFYGYDSASSQKLYIETTNSYIVSSGLIHVMASWSLAATAAHLYVNNISDLNTSTDVLVDADIDYTSTDPDYSVGGVKSVSSHATYLNACLGGLYISRTYLDLSDSGNRAKFYNSANEKNNPPFSVDLGADGSIPESAQPLIYLNHGIANGTNAGSGGDFVVNGSTLNGC